MSRLGNSLELLFVVFVWLLWYGLAIAKEIRKNRIAESKPVQLLITDIWASMPGMVLVCYSVFTPFIDHSINPGIFDNDIAFRATLSVLYVASQFAGLLLFFLQLSRFKKSNRMSRAYRALVVLLGSILNILTCSLVISFAYSILNGTFLCSTILLLVLVWIFRGLKED